MRIRTRLALTVIVVMGVIIAGMIGLDAVQRHRFAEHALTEFTLHVLAEPGSREACEADPAGWWKMPMPALRREGEPPTGARPMLWVFDAELRPASPRAPSPHDLDTPWWDEEVWVLVRTPWKDGPCAAILARGTTVPGWIGSFLPANPFWMLPMLALLIPVLVSMGPVIRRLHRLSASVRRSAAGGFVDPVAIEGNDEVADVARAFDAAIAEKDRREQTLREFLINTTHDVMIPLTVLKGHLTALKQQGGADHALLLSAMREAHYLGSLMHNLAAAAKLEAGEPGLVRGAVDLGELLERVLSRHRPVAARLGVSLEGAPPARPLVTHADVTLLEQAVSNVVYNAIRHNREGGHVAVLVEPSGTDRFRLRVVDDGPGLAEGDLSRLVERGFRGGNARTRTSGGQGIGLHITSRVAQLHGFDLAFARSQHGGLQVDLAGPIAEPLPGGTPTPRPAQRDSPRSEAIQPLDRRRR